MIDHTTLLAGAALSAIVLAVMMFAACLVARQTGYLLTLAWGVLGIGLGCAALWLCRLTPNPWLAFATMALLTGGFLIIHRAIAQYVGDEKLSRTEIAAALSITAAGALVVAGYDGAGFLISYLATVVLLLQTASVFWRHRTVSPYLMAALTVLATISAVTFAFRAIVLFSDFRMAIGGAPDNWAEDLTALLAIPCITAFGPMALALHHVRAQVQLRSETITDALTGLHNRRALMASYGDQLFTADMAIIMFDLDHFKHTNDIFGHMVGDDVLKRFASIVKRYTIHGTNCFRLGGEEFALVVPAGADKRANDLAVKICVVFGAEVVSTPIGPLRSTVSAGVAWGRDGGTSLLDVLASADAALYEAKRSGRNRAVANRAPRPVNTLPAARSA